MAANPDFSAARPAPAWRQKLSTFWRWWTEELVQLVPERLSSLRGVARVPLVAIEGDDVLLVEGRGSSTPGPDSRVSLTGLDAGRQRSAVRGLLERAGESRSRARLCLASGEALVRRVTMPAATEENLRQVLAFEMDRLTPFRSDEVYFDYRVLSRDAAAGTLVALLGVARRDVVDTRLAAMRALGVSVQGVSVREDLAHSGALLDLLPHEQRGERRGGTPLMLRRALTALVLLLLLVALVLPAWRKRETVVALLPMVSKAENDARATDTLLKELERQVSDYNFLLTKKHGVPQTLAYVEELTRLLPDTTWLQQLDIRISGKAREVQITGETPSASKLIEVLEQSSLLQNATPRGTVTRGSQPNLERFQIVAETRPRPLPETRAVLDTQGAPVAGPGAPPPATAAPANAAPATVAAPVATPATPPKAPAAAATPPSAPAAATPPPTPAQLDLDVRNQGRKRY